MEERARIRVVCIEGNIAAGKTTYIEHVGRALEQLGYGVVRVCEPIDEWTSVGRDRVNMLAAAYTNPRENAFPFQLTALVTHVRAVKAGVAQAQMLLDASNGALERVYVLVERSAASYKYVFARLAELRQDISTTCAAVYDLIYAQLVDVNYRVHAIVYLKASPDLCLQRRRQRGRQCEETAVDRDYLTTLNTMYGMFVDNAMVNGDGAVRVHTVNVDVDLKQLIDTNVRVSQTAVDSARNLHELTCVR